MDGLGQTGNDGSADQEKVDGINGHTPTGHYLAPRRAADESWSSAGAALEPSFEPLVSWTSPTDRRGIEALQGADMVDDALASTLVHPRFTPFTMTSPAEDPYADELAQRSAEFARHAAFDEPTPAQGVPQVPPRPPAWQPPAEPPIVWQPPPAPADELVSPLPATDPELDPPLAAQLTLGQRFGMAFQDPAEAAAAAQAAMAAQAEPQAREQWQPGLMRVQRQTPQQQDGWRQATPPEAPAAHDQGWNEPGASDIKEPNLASEQRWRPEPAVSQRPDMNASRNASREGDEDLDGGADGLPKRIPSEPDVPEHDAEADTPGPPLEEKPLTRIASHLRRDDVPEERPDGFDVEAVLAAVRAVAGVREATMRTTPAGAHHLRLELAEGADPATISRMVARMLQDQMGLDAALTGAPAAPGLPPMIPGQSTPSEPPPVVLPGPRTGLGAALPPAVENWPEQVTQIDRDRLDHPHPVREPRRRHPVSVPRRQPSELRPSERAAATWRTAGESDEAVGSTPPALSPDREQGPRPIIEHVQTSTFGLDATVEVRLTAGSRHASGVASGPAVDAYVLRLCAAATAAAVDELLSEGTTTGEPGRCYIEHAALVPMGSCDVAVVVVLLVCGGWVEQLAGSALVSGDPRRAVVRATLSAVNRRLAGLLP